MKTATRIAMAIMLLAAAPVAAAEFTADEQAQIDARVRAYILENPEIILEAMDVLENRRKLQREQADKHLISVLGPQLFDDGFSHVGGAPDGDVTIIEFSDYRCAYCKQAHDGVKALVETDGGIRLIVKEFPILGEDSVYAARAAMAAMAQGGDLYTRFNDQLMRQRGSLDRKAVLRVAREVGLDAERLENDLADPKIGENIRQTYALARQLEITGTPAFIVGDRIVRGFLPYDGLRELVEAARDDG